jgi:peptide/nickel transport system permease protein
LTAYIIRRTAQAVIVMVLSTIIIFSVMRFLPGDPILLYISQDDYSRSTSAADIDALRAEFGLDKSIPEQYVNWVWRIVAHGDFGDSIFFGTTVVEEIGYAMPITLFIGTITFVLANLLGIPAGVICAIRRGKWIDTVLTVSANFFITAPVFWFGILLIYFFGLYLEWLPIQGYTSPFEDFSLSMQKLIMPVMCMILFPLSGTVRQTRSAMLEIIHQDYIRTAWAKGLSEKVVVIRHTIKNGVIPVVTLAGMGIRMILGGQVLVEVVFNIPGMGRLATTALFNKDYAIVQGVVLVMTLIIVLSNLLVDISYGWLDPRIRYE